MLFDDPPNVSQFVARKTAAALQAHRIEPELCFAIVALHVDVWRLRYEVAHVKVEPIRAFKQDGRHKRLLLGLYPLLLLLPLVTFVQAPARLAHFVLAEGVVTRNEALRAHLHFRQVAPVQRVVDGLAGAALLASGFSDGENVRFGHGGKGNVEREEGRRATRSSRPPQFGIEPPEAFLLYEVTVQFCDFYHIRVFVRRVVRQKKA